MKPYRCPVCKGHGHVITTSARAVSIKKCQPCRGSGYLWKVAELPAVAVTR